jgi:hypothetical protein
MLEKKDIEKIKKISTNFFEKIDSEITIRVEKIDNENDKETSNGTITYFRSCLHITIN